MERRRERRAAVRCASDEGRRERDGEVGEFLERTAVVRLHPGFALAGILRSGAPGSSTARVPPEFCRFLPLRRTVEPDADPARASSISPSAGAFGRARARCTIDARALHAFRRAHRRAPALHRRRGPRRRHVGSGRGRGRSVSDRSPPAASDTPVARARELLARAKFLDEAGSADDKAAVDLQQRLPALRAAAKAARERASRATGRGSGAPRRGRGGPRSGRRRQRGRDRHQAAGGGRKPARRARSSASSDEPRPRGFPSSTTDSEGSRAIPPASSGAPAAEGCARTATPARGPGSQPRHVSLVPRQSRGTAYRRYADHSCSAPGRNPRPDAREPGENLKKTTVVTIKPGETASRRLAF